MAVPEQTPYIEHTGNGVTTSFSLEFQCESKDHLIVLVDEIEPPIATWSLTGGNVVFTTAPAAGKKITLQRNTPFNRTAEYQSFNNSFRPQSVNGDFDRLWLKLQELGVADWLMKLYVDRLHQQQEQKINDLKGYVDDRDDELRAYLMDEIRKQGVALDQLDEYYNYLMQQLAQIAVNRGWDASFIADAGGSTQQDINDFGGSKWRNKAGGYALGATVKLANGDTVQSTKSANIANPNVDMTGWVNTNDASQIFYGTLSQDSINFDTFNTPEKYGADKNAEDNTAALQAWLNSSETLHVRPFRIYKFSGTLDLNIVNQSINGLSFNTYGNSILKYTGSGTALKSSKNVGYLKINNFQILPDVKTANAVFDNGTIGIDLTLGGTIDANGLLLQGFETLAKSAGSTFYNKLINCRLGYCRTCLMGFASYNLNIMFTRVLQFTNFLTTVSGAGPINIKYNSFEGFNGNIHGSNNDKCELNFHDNYVEVFDNIALPVNFVRAANQTKGDFFGGNTLFQGYYSKCSLRGNKLSIGGAFRLGNFSTCAYLESVGNGISLYRENNNLGALFTNSDTYTSVDVNDFYNGYSGEDGGYSRTYGRSSFNNIASFRNKYFYYDCILNENMPLVARSTQPTLLNGWVASSGSGGSGIRVIANADGSTTVIGSVTGTGKTANAIFNIPDKHRPVEIGNTQTFIVFLSKSQNGVGDNVTLRYYYGGANAGNFELMSESTLLANIPINFVIPQRI